jgi:hypothetical protein
MARPNLFHFATSELSQDALLCWMLAWAPVEFAKSAPELHTLATNFIALAFAKHGLLSPILITTITVQRQVKKIDLVATINGTYVLLVEDKAGTQEHSNQLERYLQAWDNQKQPGQSVVPIYVQTGEQSSYQSVEAAGFRAITRAELLELITEAVEAGERNAILCDFHAYLADLERQFQAYLALPLEQTWPSRAWQGFFSALQQRLGRGDWGRVPTASQGFEGFWWNWLGQMGAAEPYLQLEYNRLCFKLCNFTAIDTRRIDVARDWHQRLAKAAIGSELRISKPGRHQEGRTMTAAILATDFRVANWQGFLDMDATVVRLEAAELLLRQVAQQMRSKAW